MGCPRNKGSLKILYHGYIAMVKHKGQVVKGFAKGFICNGYGLVDKESTEDSRTGINWTLFDKLKHLEFADNISLITSNKQQIQKKQRN